MSTETMERPVVAAPVVALTPPQRAAVALNTAEYEIKLRELLTNSVAILAVTNKAGRDECHTAYMVLKNTRCAITNLSEGATEDAKAFTKAVKAEAIRLIAITTAEEDRLEGLRDGWDEAEKARKAALLAAEDARKDAIKTDIQSIRDTVAGVAGQPSAAIKSAIDKVEEIKPSAVRFAEFAADALKAAIETIDKLVEMFESAKESEAAALAAEEARKAEAARIEQERQELAKLRADAERIANEQAVERQRLADLAAAQEAEARRVREQAAANLKADRDAQELHMRIEREQAARERAERDQAAAEQQRQLAAQQAEIDAKRAAFAREQEGAAARVEAAAKMEADHAEALTEDAQRDIDREARREQDHLDSLAQDDAAADLARCTETAKAMLTQGRSLIADSIATYIDAGMAEDSNDEPVIDYEAIAWAYAKLLAYGVGNTDMAQALMLDRLNAMLLAAA